MGDEYNKGLCEERHKNIERLLMKIDENTKILFGRLNWFYVLAIGSLVAAVSALITSCS